MGIDTIGPLLVMGVILGGAVLVIRHSVRNYRLHQEEAYAKEQGIEITLPASSAQRSGPTIGFSEAVFALLVSFFRLTVLPVTHISSHLEARKLFMTLIQVRRSAEGEEQWNTYSDPDDEEEESEEDDEEEMLVGHIVDQDPVPVVPLSPGFKTTRLTPEMAAQIVQNRDRSSFRTEESGRSVILSALVQDDKRHTKLMIQGFVKQIHDLAVRNERRVTRDPFVNSRNDTPEEFDRKITRKEWDELIGSPEKPGMLREARVIQTDAMTHGAIWPYEHSDDAFDVLWPILRKNLYSDDTTTTNDYYQQEESEN